jgi:hypothetical protein
MIVAMSCESAPTTKPIELRTALKEGEEGVVPVLYLSRYQAGVS